MINTIGQQHAGKDFVNTLDHDMQEIIIDENGEAEFYCPGGAVSVLANKDLLQNLAPD